MTLRYRPGLGLVVSVTSVLLMLGAVYGGFHYAVDIVAGAILGIVVALPIAMRSPRTS
jgi:membrane-associated phospholipid phosphatase